jgi:hypothetical protein
MVDVNELPDAPSISRLATWREFGAQLSGPLRGTSGLLLSGRFARAQHHERERRGLRTSDATSIFGHFVTNRADLDQVRLVGTLQRVNAPYEGRRQFRDANISEQAPSGSPVLLGIGWARAVPDWAPPCRFNAGHSRR